MDRVASGTLTFWERHSYKNSVIGYAIGIAAFAGAIYAVIQFVAVDLFKDKDAEALLGKIDDHMEEGWLIFGGMTLVSFGGAAYLDPKQHQKRTMAKEQTLQAKARMDRYNARQDAEVIILPGVPAVVDPSNQIKLERLPVDKVEIQKCDVDRLRYRNKAGEISIVSHPIAGQSNGTPGKLEVDLEALEKERREGRSQCKFVGLFPEQRGEWSLILLNNDMRTYRKVQQVYMDTDGRYYALFC